MNILDEGYYIPDEGYYIFDEGYYILDEGYYILDEGYYILDEGYYILDEGYYILDEGYYRNSSCPLSLISTFLFTMYIYLITDSNGRLCDVDSIGKILLIALPNSNVLA